MPMTYQPIKTRRTFEIIVDLLKEKIFSGEYQPGDRLPVERDLAEMVQVSRSAVREAYHALELFDIVEIRKGTDGGTFIKEPTHRSITQNISDLIRLRRVSLSDMVETRLVLEKDLAELALQRIKPQDFEKLEGCVTRAFALLKKGVPAHKENIQFHLYLAEVSRNALLLMVYSSVMDLFHLALQSIGADFEMSQIIAEEHREIINLLKKGERDPLLLFLDKHIRGSNDRLLEKSKKYPELDLETVS